jgi:hypothetical protein
MLSTEQAHSCDARKHSICKQSEPPLQPPPPRLGERVERHREHDDHADHDLLDVGRHVHQHEPIQQHADQDRADHGAEDRARAAEQAGAGDHHRGDDGQLVVA